MTDGPDLTEFERLTSQHPPRRRPCPVEIAWQGLGDEERAQLIAALNKPNGVITAKAISAWLDNHGHPGIKYGSVKSHRKGECTCGD